MMGDAPKLPGKDKERLVWPDDLPTDVRIIEKGVGIDDIQRVKFRLVLQDYLKCCLGDFINGDDSNIGLYTENCIDTLNLVLKRGPLIIIKDLEDMQSGRLIDTGSPSPITSEQIEQAEIDRKDRFKILLERLEKRAGA